MKEAPSRALRLVSRIQNRKKNTREITSWANSMLHIKFDKRRNQLLPLVEKNKGNALCLRLGDAPLGSLSGDEGCDLVVLVASTTPDQAEGSKPGGSPTLGFGKYEYPSIGSVRFEESLRLLARARGRMDSSASMALPASEESAVPVEYCDAMSRSLPT